MAVVDKPFNDIEIPVVGEVETKKKPKKKASSQQVVKDEGNNRLIVSSLVAGVFACIAVRSPEWELSEKEVSLIAEPAGRILDRMESVSEEKMDTVSLLIAIVMIISVRVVPKIVEKLSRKRVINEPDAGEIEQSSGRNVKSNANNNSNNARLNLKAIQ